MAAAAQERSGNHVTFKDHQIEWVKAGKLFNDFNLPGFIPSVKNREIHKLDFGGIQRKTSIIPGFQFNFKTVQTFTEAFCKQEHFIFKKFAIGLPIAVIF
jgi:hypothetical protein